MYAYTQQLPDFVTPEKFAGIQKFFQRLLHNNITTLKYNMQMHLFCMWLYESVKTIVYAIEMCP